MRSGPNPSFEAQETHDEQRTEREQPNGCQKRPVLQSRVVRRHGGMIAMKARSLPTLRIIVLAAGFSTRLGRPKALARVHGVTLLRKTLGLLAPFATSSKIIVVIP